MKRHKKVVSLACLGLLLAASASAAESGSQEIEIVKGVAVSGLVEVEGSYVNTKDNSETDLILSTFELGIEAKMNDWISARGVLLYEEDGDDRLIVDEAYIRMKKEDMPFFVEVGRLTQVFGNFATGMISDPLTLELGETKHHASLRVGYEAEPFTASLSVWKGDVQKSDKSDINSYVAAIALGEKVSDGFRYELGASYINNIGDTDGLQDSFGEDDRRTSNFVGGYSVYGIAGFGDLEFRAEYLAAADRFSDGDMEGLRPRAYNFEIGYDFLDPLHLAVRYGGAEDFSVERQYGATLAYDLTDFATVALEYLHVKDEESSNSDMVTLQLAMGF